MSTLRNIPDIFDLVIKIPDIDQEFKILISQLRSPINGTIGYLCPEDYERQEKQALKSLGYLAEICYPPSEDPSECAILVCGHIMNKNEEEVRAFMKQRIKDRCSGSIEVLMKKYEDIILTINRHNKEDTGTDPLKLYVFQKKNEFLLSLKLEIETILAEKK